MKALSSVIPPFPLPSGPIFLLAFSEVPAMPQVLSNRASQFSAYET